MKFKKIILTIFCFFIMTSFYDVDKKPKGNIIFQGSIITKTWIPLHGKINVYLEKNTNGYIKSISAGGIFLGFEKIGTIEIENRTSDTLKISKGTDKDVLLVLDNSFNQNGGKIYITLFMYKEIKKDSLYILKKKNSLYQLYKRDSFGIKRLESLEIIYSLKKGIIKYKSTLGKPYL